MELNEKLAKTGSHAVLTDEAARAVVALRETHGDCLFVAYLLNPQAVYHDVVLGAPALGKAMTCPVNATLAMLYELEDEAEDSTLQPEKHIALLEGGASVPGRVCLSLARGTTVVVSAVPLVGR